MSHSLRIVYMGTPDFAVAPLQQLLQSGFDIVGVITVPDKPAGRGQKLQQSPVKQFAEQHHLPLLQPERLRDDTFINALHNWNADLFVVVAFRMLPEIVWAMPPKGTINLHASLLPQYRGAAPINHAIINGERYTGVTTFFITHEIDTGNILFQDKVVINENETAGELHDKLMNTGAVLLLKTVEQIEKGQITPTAQEDTGLLKAAPKIFKENCRINWNQPAQQIHNFIRGLSPYPAAWSELSSGDEAIGIKIYHAKTELGTPCAQPGTIISDEKTFLKVCCNDGYIVIEELQASGKKRLATHEFLLGFRNITCHIFL